MDRKTYFITAAAITGVVLAGTTAIAANIGILNAADDDNVGNLTAVVVTTPATVPTDVEPQIVDVYVEEPAPKTVPSTNPPVDGAESTSQEFKVDKAGTVTVERTADGILLDGATVNEGWDWTSTQSSPTDLVVTFTSGGSQYVFYAGIADDGSITARVDEPIVNVVQVPAAPAPTGSVATAPPAAPVQSYDDDDRYEDDDESDDDDRYEDDDESDDDDDEHEGGDDDD